MVLMLVPFGIYCLMSLFVFSTAPFCHEEYESVKYHDLMEIILESMMVVERGEFLAKNPGNKGNYDVSQLFA